MLFSVIIPTYNRLGLLREELASVRSQRFLNFEVIVVDDGSTDGTSEALSKEGDWLRVLSQPNRGPGAARNLGAQAAHGEYLAFLDSDDLWFPWTLETYARVVNEHCAPGLIVGRNIHFNDGQTPIVAEKAFSTLTYRQLYDAMQVGDVSIPTASCSIRRDWFESIGGFAHPPTAEDVDLWLRAGCVPGYIHVVAPVLSAQRQHQRRVTRDLPKMLDGLSFLISQERSNRYPGGSEQKPVRKARLAMASRSIAVDCLQCNQIGWGLRTYLVSFGMNLRQYRFRFLFGYPVLALIRLFKNGATKCRGKER